MITKVLRNAAWLGIGEAGVKGGLFVAAILVARGAGPSGVGTFSIAVPPSEGRIVLRSL